MSETEKYLFGLRENDIIKEDSAGPGDHYRNWLKQNNLNSEKNMSKWKHKATYRMAKTEWPWTNMITLIKKFNKKKTKILEIGCGRM